MGVPPGGEGGAGIGAILKAVMSSNKWGTLKEEARARAGTWEQGRGGGHHSVD